MKIDIQKLFEGKYVGIAEFSDTRGRAFRLEYLKARVDMATGKLLDSPYTENPIDPKDYEDFHVWVTQETRADGHYDCYLCLMKTAEILYYYEMKQGD
jgi:hypothetical protein